MEIIGLVSLAWVLTEWMKLIAEQTKYHKLMRLVCLKCYSFWLALFYTQDIFTAAICGLTGYALELILIKYD